MKEVLRIVITGGPCGGKTTALKMIKKMFEEYGYTVFLVRETATDLIGDNMKPFGKDKLPLIEFQRLIFLSQLAKEKLRDYAAEICDNDKVAIIYDRGILDNRAYITHEEFRTIVEDEGMHVEDFDNRYDLVLHLETAAKGKPEKYITSNNEARKESIKEAIEVDDKTLEAWDGYPNRYIFENDCDFPEKIDRVKIVVRNFLKKGKTLQKRLR